MMDFRLATDADLADVKALWRCSFESDEPYFSWYFQEVYRPEQTLCACAEGQLLANLQLAPYTAKLRGAPVPCHFFVGVITQPQLRHTGIGLALMAEGLRFLNQTHVPFAVLYPLAPAFYRKCGFEHCYEEHIWRLPREALHSLAADQAPSYREVDLYDYAAKLPVFNELYLAMMNGQNGFILRDQHAWKNILEEHRCDNGRALLVEDEAGRPSGYVLFTQEKTIGSTKPQEGEARLDIREIAYTSPESRAAIFHLLAKLDSPTVYWRAPAIESAHLYLPRNSDIRLAPAAMGRVVTVSEALAAIAYPPQAMGSVVFRLHDEKAPWNDNTWKLEVQDGRGQIGPADPRKQEQAELELDIASLSALVFGSLSLWQLVKEGRIRGELPALARLDAFFPPTYNYLGQNT